MSGGLDALSLREDDVKKFLVCGTHLGATNLDFQMEQYVYKRKTDGMLRSVLDSDRRYLDWTWIKVGGAV